MSDPSTSGPGLGQVAALLIADTAQFDGALKQSSMQMRAAAKVAELMGTKVSAAGEKVDAAARVQVNAADRARRAWQRELQAQERAAQVATETSRAQELAALKTDILARSQGTLSHAMQGSTSAGFDLRHQIGLIDNTIRGAHGMAMADLVRGFAQSKIVMAALPIGMTVAGIALLGGVIGDLAEKYGEWRNRQHDLTMEMEQFQTSMQQMSNSAVERFLEVEAESDRLKGDHLGALRDELKLIDMQTMDDLVASLDRVGSAADKAFETLNGHFYNMGKPAEGAKNALTDFKIEYNRLMSVGNTKGAGDLLAGTLAQAQKVLALQHQLQNTPKWVAPQNAVAGDYGAGLNDKWMHLARELQTQYGRGASDAEVKAQQDLVEALAHQLSLTKQIVSTGDLKKQNAQHKDLNPKTVRSQDPAVAAMEALRTQLAQRQALNPMSPGEVASFWKQALPQFDKNSPQFQQVQEQIAQAVTKIHEQIQEGMRRISSASMRSETLKSPAGFLISKDGTLAVAAHASELLAAAQTKAAQSAAQLNLEWAVARDRLGQTLGVIGPYQAALDLQAQHAQDFRLQLQALQEELQGLQQNDLLNNALGGDPALGAKEQQLRTQIGQVQNQAKIAQMMDAQNVLDQTWKGAIESVWDTLIAKAQNASQELARVGIEMTDGLNTQLARAMTGQHPTQVQFGEVFRSAAQSTAKIGLQTAEGFGLKALFGSNAMAKLGSRDNPMWTRSADAGITGPSGMLSSIFGSTVPNVTGTAASGSGGWLSKVLGFASKIPFLAAGGSLSTGMPAIVGEKGPELFVPSSSGRVVPNHQLGAMGGTTVHVDARGAHDPAAVEASVHRAMRGYMAMVPSMAVAAVHDYNSRRPATHRMG